MRISKQILFFYLILIVVLNGCKETSNLLDLALDPPGRKTIDVSRMGVNNFFVDPEFGSISGQYSDIKNNLKLKHVRVLFAWTDGVQPTPSSPLNYSFYDNIVNNRPAGVDLLLVLTHTPSWMSDSSNWIDGDPKKTFVEKWIKPTVARYKDSPGVIAYEVWNEPDLTVVPSDAVLGLTIPENYMSMLVMAAPAIKAIDPNGLVVVAAPQSLQQNFPVNLNYSKRLKELGAENLVDIWNFHFYSTSFESVITQSGVADFLNGISRPIWLTESGENGPTKQLAYVETAWPFLREKVSGIDRIYYYQYGEKVPVEQNFGLRTTDPAFPGSDLYIYLSQL